MASVATMPALAALTTQWLRAKVSSIVTSHTRLRPLCQGLKVDPLSLFPSLFKSTGSKVEGKLMWVNDLLRMELMAECLGRPAAFLMQRDHSLSTNLP